VPGKPVNFESKSKGEKPFNSPEVPAPGNKGKGGKSRRRGKNENEPTKRELVVKEEGQEYAQVVKMLGNERLEAFCFDGKTRQCHIRGKMQKKVWINKDDIILISLRDYQDDKCDVILKYNADEIMKLKQKGELPSKASLASDILEDDEDEDCAFSFENL